MAIATTFTTVYMLRRTLWLIYRVYFAVFGWIILKGEGEIDLAKEVQDVVLMVSEHITFFEGGPLTYRVIALVVDIIFVTEEAE